MTDACLSMRHQQQLNMRHRGFFSACCAVVLLWLLPAPAQAYPQYLGRGDFNCSDCHYSPTGGGLINGWGRSSRESTYDFGDPDDFPGHSDATGLDDDENATLDFDVGADVRTLPLVNTGAGPTSAVFVPMLFEVGGVAAYGGLRAYATVTGRKGTPSGVGVVPFSREHWLGYTFLDKLWLRAGRLQLPFGIRNPDHTQYVRQDFGFDKWDQSYAAEVDWIADDVTLSAAFFVGDLLDEPPRLRATGGVLRGTYTLGAIAELGASALLSKSSAIDRVAGSVFARINPFRTTYLLAEAALQQRSLRALNEKQSTNAAYLRAGWFPEPALDLFLEAGYRDIPGDLDLRRYRIGLGVNWQALQWFELIPQVMTEHLPGVGNDYTAMAQLHLLY